MGDRVGIGRLSTGVPGLDELIGSGVPELSFNLIAGNAGSGKTTLAHQMLFGMANPACRALFFTVVGEPPLKMLRYQQQYEFFDFDKLDTSVKFINLAADMVDGDFDRVIARIIDEVQDFSPSLVFVDSFGSIMRSAQSDGEGTAALQFFIQQLGMQMISWQATTFLIAEFAMPEDEHGALFTVVDGIIWLSQRPRGNTMARQIQILKMRNAPHDLGARSFRIDNAGVRVFPMTAPAGADAPRPRSTAVRLASGVPGLDAMLGGGVPQGYALLLAGPSGVGKSVLASQFLVEGARAGGNGILATFDSDYDPRLHQLVLDGNIGVCHPGLQDVSIDEFLHDLVTLIAEKKATRVVIDSLPEFELALADDFRQALRRMVKVLKAIGITVMMITETDDGTASFLADAIVTQRHVDLAGQRRRAIAVLKVRGSSHSQETRYYDIVDGRIDIGEALA
ncbi:MAG: ATPase domain-containing protein [Telluria sp.]